ncbi:MAG: hypothetical protein PSX81_02550 [bacterium]|nr:hypothetical protein [bacterium]
MLLRFSKYFSICLFFIFVSCKPKVQAKNDDILAEAGGRTLLKSDIPIDYFQKLTESDSASLLKQYINRWVEKQLMLQASEKSLTSAEKDKSKLIDDYRASLLIFEYQQKLIKEKLDTGVTESDIETFYENNLFNFQLKKNIVKIRYVKVNKSSPDLSKIKNLMQTRSTLNDSLLRLTAEKQADNFYLDDNWLYLDDIIKEIPLNENYNQQRFLSNNKFITIEENGTLYLLYIIDFRIKNTISPIEFEREKIKDILLYQRKLEFLKKTQNKLVEKALKDGEVKLYPIY